MDMYLESLRTLERDVTAVIPPTGTPISIAACTPMAPPTITKRTLMNDMPTHSRIYLDVVATAFACNITRVASIFAVTTFCTTSGLALISFSVADRKV